MSQNTLQIPGLISGKKTELEKHLSEAEIQNERLKFAEAQKYNSQQDKAKAIAALVNKPLSKAIDNNGIPNSMTTHYELTLEQAQEMFPNANISRLAKHGNQSYVDFNGTGQPYWGIDFPQKQPYQAPFELDEYKKFFPNEPKKYGPSPSRQSGLGSNKDYQEELMKYMSNAKKKSAFEEILDMLFTNAEKEQFLIDIGYFFENDPMNNAATIKRKLASGEVKTITNSVDDLFLKEITVKFKNLLLMKATLKLKLPEVKDETSKST